MLNRSGGVTMKLILRFSRNVPIRSIIIKGDIMIKLLLSFGLLLACGDDQDQNQSQVSFERRKAQCQSEILDMLDFGKEPSPKCQAVIREVVQRECDKGDQDACTLIMMVGG